MKSPRDILLERHRAVDPKLDAVRQTVLNNEGTKEQSPGTWLASFPIDVWKELIWPCRRVWAGLAVVWLAILVANVSMRSPVATTAKREPVSKETMIAFQQQKHLLEELIGPPDGGAAEPPKVSLPQPRSQKMSKSLDNHIEIAATPEETQKRVMSMVTDPQRKLRTDPGNPDICNVYAFHKIFSSAEEVERVNVECRRAGIGCVDCKRLMAKNMNANLEPFRACRADWANRPDDVWDVLYDGARRASILAEATMEDVRAAVGLPEKKK